MTKPLKSATVGLLLESNLVTWAIRLFPGTDQLGLLFWGEGGFLMHQPYGCPFRVGLSGGVLRKCRATDVDQRHEKLRRALMFDCMP